MTDKFYKDLFTLKLSHSERVVLHAMREGCVVPFMSAPYARKVMSQLRRRLAGTGWTITTNKGGAHVAGTYKLEREK